jgi:TRAP transporter TAXI family solute receptor
LRHASTSYRQDPAGRAGGRRSAGTSRPWHWLAAAAAIFGLILFAPHDGSRATEVRFFRIGTGSTGGTYFPVGGLIASAISNPPGSRECERGGSCGVPGLIAAAVSTHGSVANIESIASGEFESALSQADVAYWAYTGTGTFKKRGPITGIRTIANLFPESLHLVVRRDSFLSGVKGLRGKRFSVDREGSGTKVDALLVLKAYGLGSKNMDLLSVGSSQAADMMREGKLDGFFFVAGTPATVVTELAEESRINLLPITGPRAEALTKTAPFFAPITIPAGTYFNVGRTQTLSVGAQWVVSAEVPEQLVYEITRALWHENARRLLDKGHPKGQLIRLETALDGLGAPLHPGAERYYREIGLIGEQTPAPTDSETQ